MCVQHELDEVVRCEAQPDDDDRSRNRGGNSESWLFVLIVLVCLAAVFFLVFLIWGLVRFARLHLASDRAPGAHGQELRELPDPNNSSLLSEVVEE